ncbi:MAG: FliA/WhiG family RNA polymerase sigma factor [Thermoleophilia bacterium]|jgi:RNA polymerase sigma factor for flagellar operon FliA|nr:FliA/WhiG family RNA polymerase sigma factor [Thermoleophilia bacterium]
MRPLWRRLRASGDPRAREQLILAYAPLVKYVAGRMGSALPSHVDGDDLISYGIIGLMGAVERFDPDRGIRFETYAMARIKGAIIDELRALDWAPRSLRHRQRKIEQASVALEQRLGRPATDEELAAEVGITPGELEAALVQISGTSLVALNEFWSTPGAGGEGSEMIDVIADERPSDPAELQEHAAVREVLAEAIATLPERERIVVSLYYYDGLTLREVGEVLGVTESRVSQLHTKAVLRMKGRLDSIGPR